MAGLTWQAHCPHETSREHFAVPRLEEAISRRRLSWWGHLMRREPSRTPCLVYAQSAGPPNVDTPGTWRDLVAQAGHRRGKGLNDMRAVAEEATTWRDWIRERPSPQAPVEERTCPSCRCLTFTDNATRDKHQEGSEHCAAKMLMGL
jgi:hypothetical protein